VFYEAPRLHTDYRIGLSAWTDKSMLEEGARGILPPQDDVGGRANVVALWLFAFAKTPLT